MSCNVLIIPEDFRLDQYILQPLMRALMGSVGRPNANVRILTDPLLGGIDQAIKLENLLSIVDQYPLVNLFVLIVDRDGKPERRKILDARELKVGAHLGSGRAFLAQEAWEEVEVWALASQTLPTGWRWSDIRADLHPKENYFGPFALKRSIAHRIGGGRREIGRDIAHQYHRICSLCPEVRALESRVSAWLQTVI
ncbi:MAG TPA: hypothetical protein VFQ77_05835 [Pseudonocardiaceae bacterium]|jgi:hypothetical protein|nr:hypothetical protein [Pseudonocardiaceae bacterium]